MRRRGKLAFVSMVLFVIATACGGGRTESQTTATGQFTGTTITFSVSLAETEKAAITELLNRFRTQTGATVRVTSVTAQDLPAKLEVEVKSRNNTIHLVAQDNLALATLVDKGLVEDLSNVEIPDGVTEALIPDKFDGKQYFLPFRPNVRVTYVNRARFESANVEPPKTVDDYKTVAEKLRAQAGTGKVTLALATQPDTGPLGVTVSEWIVSHGGDPLILNDDGSVRAFTFLQGLWKAGVFAKESRLAKFDTEVDYLRGETAWFATNWPFTSTELSKTGVLNKFDVYEGWRGPERAAHVVGGDVLGIPKGVTGKQKDAAIALARYLVSREAQTTLVEKNSWPSVRADALSRVPADQQETFDAISAALKDGWYRPNVVYWSDVEKAMATAVDRILYAGQDVKTVLDGQHTAIEVAAKQKGADYPPKT